MLSGNILKMVQPHHVLLFVLLIHAGLSIIHAAPSQSDFSKLKEIAQVETSDVRLDVPITLDDATKSESNDAQGQRQKRFNNYYGFGYPPMNPVIYQNFPNNDPYPGNYGEDPLQQIYRRLQNIAGIVRYPTFNQPPPPASFPILLPVLFIPQINCGCTPNQGKTPKPNQNGTDDFNITNRFPDMEDTNQNWGIVVNPNDTEEDDGMPEDFTRPISFVPIQPNRTTSRPPPAVDHGSNQEGSNSMTTTTMSVPPAVPPAASANAPTPPSACDAAILSCCHQAQVTYDCFAAQGCPDLTPYGNPCETRVILQAINRFSRYYGQRTG